MSERIKALKQYIQELNDQGVRSTYLYQYVADSLRKTENEPVQIRRAKAFSDVLAKVRLEVLPYELIAGSMLGGIRCPDDKRRAGTKVHTDDRNVFKEKEE